MVYLLVASFSFFFSLPYWKCFLFSTTNTTNRGTTNRVFFIFSVCLSFLLIGSQLNPTLLVFYFILFYFILFYFILFYFILFSFFFPCSIPLVHGYFFLFFLHASIPLVHGCFFLFFLHASIPLVHGCFFFKYFI
jgi:hypothetical protein